MSILGSLAEVVVGPVAEQKFRQIYNEQFAPTWEDLFYRAFDTAVSNESRRLKRANKVSPNEEVSIDRQALRRALQQDMTVSVDHTSLSTFVDPAFAAELADHLISREGLIIGGHNFGPYSYAQIVRNAIREALALFQQEVLNDDGAYRRVILEEMLDDRATLQQFEQHVTRQLDAFEATTQTLLTYVTQLMPTLPGELVTPELVRPKGQGDGPMTVGQRVALGHLQDEQYMPRPEKERMAHTELIRHLRTRRRSVQNLISSFWITGRSGSGKSVLLLFLMKQLVEDDEVVYWLDNAGEQLYTFLEVWADTYPHGGPKTFIFIDDFFAPGNQEKINLAEIGRLLRMGKYSHVNWPILVTCGPSEQFEQFEVRNKSETIANIHAWSMPLMDSDEKRRLQAWYQYRTNQEPDRGDAFEQDDGLIVSIVFEFARGELSQFGGRFAERVNSLGLTDELALHLALNRLYILSPAAWLQEMDIDLRERFAALNRDDDFSIVVSEDADEQQLLRMTHPHLSNAIYKAIRPDIAPLKRAHDLAEAFERTLEGNVLIASQILKTVADFIPRVAEDIDQGYLAERFSEIWEANHENITDRYSLTFFWVNWARWAVESEHVPQQILGDTVLNHARAALGHRHRYWATLWQSLMDLYPESDALIRDGFHWLSTHRNDDSWPYVWQRLLTHGGEDTEGRLATSGISWLRRNQHTNAWPFLFQQVLDVTTADQKERVMQLGHRWLAQYPDIDAWPFVWQRLLNEAEGEEREGLLADGSTWLADHQDFTHWWLVWKHLLAEETGERRQQVIEAGLTWLRDYQHSEQWNAVCQVALAAMHGGHRRELIEITFNWLHASPHDDFWAVVWVNLLENSRGERRQRLLQEAQRWLPAYRHTDRWNIAWQNVLDEAEGEEREDLINEGEAWLLEYPHHESWPFVWQRVLEESDGEQKIAFLIEDGRRWAHEHPTLNQWKVVWKQLVDLQQEGVLKEGLTWLHTYPHSEHWPYVWEHALRVTEGEVHHQLLRAGYAWLAGKEDHPLWNFVWQVLFEYAEGDLLQSLYEDGLVWVGHYQHTEAWPHVWEKLLEKAEDDDYERLIQIGLAWLPRYRHTDRWALVWQILFTRVQRREQLVEDGFQWLDDYYHKEEPWSYVWEKLLANVTSAEQRQRLVEQGLAWLADYRHTPPWNFIWRKMLPEVDDEQYMALINDGLTWLSEYYEEVESWPYVWPIVLNEMRGEVREALIEDGLRWIASYQHTASWPFVWQRLLDETEGEQRQALVRDGLIWLEDYKDTDAWPYIWQGLIEDELRDDQQLNELIQKGLGWLAGRSEMGGWPFVWQRLLDEIDDERRHQLIEEGATWLNDYWASASWPFIWLRLVDEFEGERRQQLIAEGRQWVTDNPDVKHWMIVWGGLMDEFEGQPREQSLITEGYEWLLTHPDEERWGMVWQRLMTKLRRKRRRKAIQMGLEWVHTHREDEDWPYVWERLVEHVTAEERETFIHMGFAWSRRNRENLGWSHLVERLFENRDELSESQREGFYQQTLVWLQTEQEHDSWVFVYHRIFALRNEFLLERWKDLINMGYEWLLGHPHHDSWDRLYETFLDEFGYILAVYPQQRAIQRFIDVGREWILANQHKSQTFILGLKLLGDMHTIAESDPLYEWAYARLNEENFLTHWAWPRNWRRMWSSCPTERTARLLLVWLEGCAQPTNELIDAVIAASRSPQAADLIQEWCYENPEHPLHEFILGLLPTT